MTGVWTQSVLVFFQIWRNCYEKVTEFNTEKKSKIPFNSAKSRSIYCSRRMLEISKLENNNNEKRKKKINSSNLTARVNTSHYIPEEILQYVQHKM